MTVRTLSELLVTFVFRLVARPLFRIRVVGSEHIPRQGPVLLVSNHLTYLDAFVIGACLRPMVRFLVWKPYHDHILLNLGFRLGQSIPVFTGPHGAARAIAQSRAALQGGGVLCIFAEGQISRNGNLLPFKRGLEAIVRGTDAAIVPVHLGGLWESMYSFQGGGVFGKPRRSLRPRVAISFGPPMHSSSKAWEVREAVVRLGANAPDSAPRSVTCARSKAAVSTSE